MSEDLRNSIEDWGEYIPEHVGLISGRYTMRYTNCHQKEPVEVMELETVFKPKRQQISPETQLMVTQSMVRSMMYKIIKYKDANSLETVKGLKSDIRSLEKNLKEEEKRSTSYYTAIRKIEWYLRKKTGVIQQYMFNYAISRGKEEV